MAQTGPRLAWFEILAEAVGTKKGRDYRLAGRRPRKTMFSTIAAFLYGVAEPHQAFFFRLALPGKSSGVGFAIAISL